jgi:nucleoside-diphosphate-sugar epimerase
LLSSKDYLYIDDAVKLILDISTKGKDKIYNVASGQNTLNKEIVDELKKNIHFSFKVNENAKDIVFPTISITKIKEEFNYQPSNLIDHIPLLIKQLLYV